MAVFLCRPCGVTLIENKKDEKPVCPRCRKEMLPKVGPGAIEEEFPDKTHTDTVFRLDINNLPPSIDPVKQQEPPKKK